MNCVNIRMHGATIKIKKKKSEIYCLGNMIPYERELDIDNKLNNYLKITGI